MKIVFFSLLVLSAGVSAQNFSDKTNTVVVNYKQPVVASTLPQITWTTPRIETTLSTEASITINASLKTDLPIKELKLVLISGSETREKSIQIGVNEFSKTITQTINLMEGENTIKLVAENSKGGKIESKRTILMGKESLAALLDVNRKDYALIFATDNYENWDDLSNPVNDAHTIAGILKEKYGFETEVVENASLEDITGKVYDYNTKKFNPQDQLFVFFAGHGYFDETLGQGYVVAANSLKNDKGRTTYLAHTLIRENLDNIKCEHIFLTMDVCFGGTFDKKLAKGGSRGQTLNEADRNFLINKISKRTRKVLTSGGKQYVPDGEPGKHSPFATQFIRALRELGGGEGRVLSLIELQTYFLSLTTEPYFNGFGSDDPQSDFVFIAKQ